MICTKRLHFGWCRGWEVERDLPNLSEVKDLKNARHCYKEMIFIMNRFLMFSFFYTSATEAAPDTFQNFRKCD